MTDKLKVSDILNPENIHLIIVIGGEDASETGWKRHAECMVDIRPCIEHDEESIARALHCAGEIVIASAEIEAQNSRRHAANISRATSTRGFVMRLLAFRKPWRSVSVTAMSRAKQIRPPAARKIPECETSDENRSL